jgi:2-isopropylmalate synthase
MGDENSELKMGVTALPPGGVAKLTATAAAVAKACKQPLEARQPYVGSSAFAHKGGLHVAALAKMPSSYNHVVPGTVGNAARSVVSELSGRGNVLSAAVAAGREVSKDTAGIVLAQIKELESKGFVLEDAGASVDILFQRAAAGYRAPFNVLEFNVSASNNAFGGVVTAEGMEDAKDLDFVDDDFAPDDEDEDAAWRATSLRRESGYKRGTVSVNQVVVKVELLEYDNDDDATADSKPSAAKAIRSSRRRTKLCVAEGNGPVNALANALQLALNERFPQLKRIHLVDYQVDLLSSEGTSAAVTRVTMDFVDRGGGGTWRTVGAHASIIEASFRALVDGMEYGIAQCGPDGCAVAYEDREATEEGNGALERGVGGGVGGGVGVGAP